MQYVVLEGRDIITRFRHQIMGLSQTIYEEHQYLEIVSQALLNETSSQIPFEVAIEKWFGADIVQEENDSKVLINACVQLGRGLKSSLIEKGLYSNGGLSYTFHKRIGEDFVFKSVYG